MEGRTYTSGVMWGPKGQRRWEIFWKLWLWGAMPFGLTGAIITLLTGHPAPVAISSVTAGSASAAILVIITLNLYFEWF